MKTRPIGMLMCVLLLATGPRASFAGHEHETPPPVHEHEGEESEAGHVGTGTPADLAETWTALAETRDAINADVNAAKLGEVHDKAGRLPLLMGSLLEHSASLVPEKRARVQGAANQISKVAEQLHEAADSGDETRTRRKLKRLDGLLGLIRAQYPEGAPEDHQLDGEHSHGG